MKHERAAGPQLPRRAVALVLAGGRGSRLKDLTARRAKPAVYFGGKFRIIDFALSNCINSGIRRIGVITQYKSHSLLRHLQKGWGFLRWEMNEFVELLPAQQRTDDESWYRGTADAVYQNIDIIRDHHSAYIVVLAGDHIYKMDYAKMLEAHVESGAQCTVACIEVPRMEARAFGVMAVDRSNQILEFVEKPDDPPAMPGKPDSALASMGVYVFNTSFLFKLLDEDMRNESSSHDFGKDIIPRVVGMKLAAAHPFGDSCVGASAETEPYWRDVGTVDAYWSANIDLTTTTPALDMYDAHWPIWTYQEQLPPAKFVFDDDDRRGTAIDSIVASGCIISGSTVRRSLLFSNVRVHDYCTIEDSVVLPSVEVGRNVVLKRAVVEKHCRLPEGLTVGLDPDEDRRRFHVTERGITLVIPEMLGQQVHHLR